MRTCLRSLVDKMLAKVPGKTSRPDTATRWLWTRISAIAESLRRQSRTARASETTYIFTSQLVRWRTFTSSKS